MPDVSTLAYPCEHPGCENSYQTARSLRRHMVSHPDIESTSSRKRPSQKDQVDSEDEEPAPKRPRTVKPRSGKDVTRW
jgi:hypothetical protein